jgi:hypothetical protein
VGVATKGPDLVAPYLPKAISGQREQIEGEVVRKEREGESASSEGGDSAGSHFVHMWVAELDLLLEPGIRLNSSRPAMRPLSRIRLLNE